jgi:hypothetical protein
MVHHSSGNFGCVAGGNWNLALPEDITNLVFSVLLKAAHLCKEELHSLMAHSLMAQSIRVVTIHSVYSCSANRQTLIFSASGKITLYGGSSPSNACADDFNCSRSTCPRIYCSQMLSPLMGETPVTVQACYISPRRTLPIDTPIFEKWPQNK